MTKVEKRPSVSERLETVERVIDQSNRELLKEKDPFGLVEPRPEDQIVQEGEEGDLRQALSRVEVRRVFYRVFKLGGLMDADGDPNATIMAHHVGRRSLALDLYNAIRKVDPAVCWQMERENMSDQKSREKNQNAD